MPPKSTDVARKISGRLSLKTALGLVLSLLLVMIVLSFALGAKWIPPMEVIRATWGVGDSSTIGIVGDLRFNRTWLGGIAGAALGASGVLMQSLTGNPIAEPGILGVNAGASLGVVVGIVLFGSLAPAVAVWCALAGAACAVGCVYAVTTSALARGSATTVTLAGVALGAVFVGVAQALVLIDEDVLDAFRFWQVGSLTARSLGDAAPLLPLLLIALILALALSRAMDAIALGDDTARGLGVRPGLIRILGFSAVAVACAVATSLVGPIGFIGLLAPHAARALVGPSLVRAVPVALVLGSCFVLAADIVGRLIGRGAEVQVGVVSAFIGVPVLIAIVLSKRRLSV